MSVFGGDSWGREAQHRKRRVEDLVIEEVIDESSSVKKLCNGKFACLVCPHNPVLDSLLMYSTHCKGSRHQTAESRLKEKESKRRIGPSSSSNDNGSNLVTKQRRETSSIKRDSLDKNRRGSGESASSLVSPAAETSGDGVSGEDWKGRAWRERELKFTASGWKRDCHGRWYKDENVEFDSDEEDPNVCLAG